jgi:hypothetical protein
MKGIRIDSIKLSDIDMDKCYFNPGCALSIYKPESEHKVLAMLNKHFGPVKMHNTCCGDNFYSIIPMEDVNKLQKKRAAQMPCQDVAVYCVSCIKSMAIGEKTETQETRLDLYHAALDEYIDAH